MKSIVDLSFIINGTFGFLCALMVCCSAKTNRNANIYLAIMLFAISTRLIIRGYFELTDQAEIMRSISKNNFYVILIPFPYLYFRTLVLNQSKIQLSNALHFIFPIILLNENINHPFQLWFQYKISPIISISIASLTIIYSIASFVILRNHTWKKIGPLEIVSEQNKLIKKWTIVIFTAFILMNVRLISALYINQTTSYSSDNSLIWINSIIWFVICLIIITSPEILNGYLTQLARVSKLSDLQKKETSFWRLKPFAEITNEQDYQLSIKIETQLEGYFHKIDDAVRTKLYFRNAGFSMNDFALKLGMPKSHLSFVFKYHAEINFSDFKKIHRIKHAIQLIEENFLTTNTFDSLAKEVGFTTYNTFYLSFKEVTGLSPQNYISSLEKVIPA